MNQTEVCRAATDITNQNLLTGRYDRLPFIAMRIDPGIEGGLRLLEKQNARQPCQPRCSHREFSGNFVERSGNGQYDF